MRWQLHQCKSFACLDRRVVGDCRNCFNMTLEWKRWGRKRAGLDIDRVMALKPRGLRWGCHKGCRKGCHKECRKGCRKTCPQEGVMRDAIRGARKGARKGVSKVDVGRVP